MSMMGLGLGLGLRDGGGWVYACIEGVSTDGRVEGFGVEILEVYGIIRPGHWIRHICCSARKL